MTSKIAEDYGFSWDNHASQLSQKYSLSEASQVFPAFKGWMKANGYTDGDFMQVSECVAAHNNEVWKHHAAGYNATCQSRANVEWPHGKYNINFPLTVAFGKYTGQGTSKFYSGGAIGQGSTDLYVDHSNWVGDQSSRNIFQSSTWGQDDIYSYNESFLIEGFRLGGKSGAPNDPSFESSGVAIWDAGETSEIRRVYADQFNTDGFTFVRGTPVRMYTCSSFHNGRFGFGAIGGALNNYLLVGPSGDNNGFALCGSIGGAGRVAGGLWTIIGGKMESYNEPNVFGTPGDGMIFFYGEGYTSLVVNGMSLGNHDVWTDAAIVLKDLVNTCTVDVNGMRGYDQTHVLQVDGTRYNMEHTQYGGVSFEYNSKTGFHSNSPFTASEGVADVLGYLDRDPQTGQPIGSFDYQNGTPVRNWQTTSPPPPTGHYNCGEWSKCFDGIQTRQCTPVGDVSGVPEPLSQRECQNIPPPPSGALTAFNFEDGNTSVLSGAIPANAHAGWSQAVINNGTLEVTNRNVKYNVDIPNAGSIILKGVTFTDNNWGNICDGVQIAPGPGDVGLIYVDGSDSGVAVPLNEKTDLQISFQNRTLTTLFNGPGSFHAALMSVESLEVW